MCKCKYGAFLAGAVVGTIAALLYAPRSGQETRALVADRAQEYWGNAQDLGTQAGMQVQGFAQQAADRGQAVYSEVITRGSHLAESIQGATKTSFAETSDELRNKIDAARARIASQVAQNAADAQGVCSVAGAEDAEPEEACACAVDQAEEACACTVDQAEEACACAEEAQDKE